jgi:hypothetical protein
MAKIVESMTDNQDLSKCLARQKEYQAVIAELRSDKKILLAELDNLRNELYTVKKYIQQLGQLVGGIRDGNKA